MSERALGGQNVVPAKSSFSQFSIILRWKKLCLLISLDSLSFLLFLIKEKTLQSGLSQSYNCEKNPFGQGFLSFYMHRNYCPIWVDPGSCVFKTAPHRRSQDGRVETRPMLPPHSCLHE
jgi:hypothetical protein